MKRIISVLNYIAILFLFAGLFLVYYLYDKKFIGWIVFGIGIILFGLYFYFHRDSFKSSLKRKSLIYGSNLFVIVLLVFAIIGALNIFFSKLQLRYDLTESKIYSLSQQTIKVLKNLKEDLYVKAFYTDGPAQSSIEDKLKMYRFYSKHFKYEIIDPNKNPGLAKKYNIVEDGTLVFEYKGKEEKITMADEEEITNTIIKITRDKKRKICFLSGHGEADPESGENDGASQLRDSLKKIGYEVLKFSIAEKGEIPSECDILVVFAPKTELFDKEVEMIDEFIKSGKGALFMFEPNMGKKLSKLVKKYGIKVDDDVIVDPVSRVLSGDPLIPIIQEYAYHEITKNFSIAALFPMARSVEKLKPEPENCLVTEIAKTSRASWGETELEKEIAKKKITFNKEKDKPGPLSVLVVSEVTIKKDKEKEETSRIAVFGDSDFARNSFIGASGNENLILNTINWLSQEKDLISITPRTARSSLLTMTPSEGKLVFFVSIVLLPLVFFVLAIIVWIRRRSL